MWNFRGIIFTRIKTQRQIQDGEGAWSTHLPFFAITCSFFFFAVTLKNYKLCYSKLNWSLIMHYYVYLNTIETCLTPNHLLFGRQIFYSSNTTSTVVRNLTVISGPSDKINCINNHFLDRWRHEFTWDTMNIKIKYRLPKN